MQPFYTTKNKGTGLGTVSYRIAQAHHGEIVITSEENVGAIIGVILPVTPNEGEWRR